MKLMIYWNAILFLAIALLHIYWAFGGRWGYTSVIPTNLKGKFLFKPGIFASLVVASGLLVFSFVYLAVIHPFFPSQYDSFHRLALYMIAIVFSVRAIGDRNYVGLFRKVSHTKFAKLDSKYFTPLCLYLASSSFFIALFF